jgi:hypothetical protein
MFEKWHIRFAFSQRGDYFDVYKCENEEEAKQTLNNCLNEIYLMKNPYIMKNLLAEARVLIAMDTLPENVSNEEQRHHAENLLNRIDSLLGDL